MTPHDDTARRLSRAFMPYPEVAVPHVPGGPLAGLRFGVKDLFDVAGYPTSGGQPLLLAMSGIKTHTAPTVQRLLDAGAAFGGKTLTDELAFLMTGQNAHFGAPVNAGAPDRITGGSSSGSASAVSHGLVDFALGTDTGGSVRAPANHCGLVGLRPTHGRVSLQGCLDLSPSFDTCGWFARDVPTFARVADVLLGERDAQPLPATPRLLFPADLWSVIEPPVHAALAGARGVIEAALGAAASCEVVIEGFDALVGHFRHLQGHEAWRTDGEFIERYAPPLGPGVAERFASASKVTEAQVQAAAAYRERLRTHVAGLLGDDGVLVLPTMPDVAPLRTASHAELEDYRNRAHRLLSVAGLTGLPQLSLPWAVRLGAPLGLSLMAPAGRDRSLVRLAEQLAPQWARRVRAPAAGAGLAAGRAGTP